MRQMDNKLYAALALGWLKKILSHYRMALYVFPPSASEHDGSFARMQITRGGSFPRGLLLLLTRVCQGAARIFGRDASSLLAEES